MARKVLLLYEPDLLFSSWIESSCRKAGFDVKVLATENELQQAVKEQVPRIWLVSLDSLKDGWKALTGLVRGTCRLIGYYSHVNSKLGQEALANGFDAAIPRRALSAALDEVLADTD